MINQKVLLPYQNLLNTDSLGHNVIEKALTFCSNELLIYKFWTFEDLNHLGFTEIGSSFQAKCGENVICFPLIQPTDK
jgi:hypothetical protein